MISPRLKYSRHFFRKEKVRRAFLGELTECRSFSLHVNGNVLYKASGIFLEGEEGFFVPHTKTCTSEKEVTALYWQLINEKLREGFREVFSVEDALNEDTPVVPTSARLPDFHSLSSKDRWFRPWKASPITGVALRDVFASGRGRMVEYPVGFPVLFMKEDESFNVYSQDLVHTDLIQHLPLVNFWTQIVGQIIPDRTMILAQVVPLEGAKVSHRILLDNPANACKEQDHRGYLGLYPYDILVWAGAPVAQLFPYDVRLGLLRDIAQSVESRAPTTGLEYALIGGAGYKTKEVYRMNLDEAPMSFLEPVTISVHTTCDNIPLLLRRKEVQRCLVFDPTQPFKGSAWSMRGAPPRPPHVGLWRDVQPQQRA